MTSSIASPRLAFVSPRYGPTVVGGAETLCRLVAEDLAAAGVDVSVLTTCATNHFTWENTLPRGESHEGGVTVRRFPVSARDPERWAALHARIALGDGVDYLDELAWMGNSVWSEPMLDAVADERRYDWIIALPYLFGTTFWATAVRPQRVALLPCLHDEPHARTRVVADMIRSAGGCFANCDGEAELIRRLVPGTRPTVAGVGYVDNGRPPFRHVEAFCRRRNVAPGYLLYAGRREIAKGVGQLLEDYAVLRRIVSDAPPLVLMGSGDLPVPDELVGHVVDFGYVAADEMSLAYAGASVFIHPSPLESLGMVALECWLAGTPVLVNARSDVLRRHCVDSGGGLWYRSTSEFCAALGLLLAEPPLRERLARAGRRYVLETFSWPSVRRRILGALEAWS